MRPLRIDDDVLEILRRANLGGNHWKRGSELRGELNAGRRWWQGWTIAGFYRQMAELEGLCMVQRGWFRDDETGVKVAHYRTAYRGLRLLQAFGQPIVE